MYIFILNLELLHNGFDQRLVNAQQLLGATASIKKTHNHLQSVTLTIPDKLTDRALASIKDYYKGHHKPAVKALVRDMSSNTWQPIDILWRLVP
jgi:galactose-1-phosphate uridylyltransferase